jgi:hypothetical protein
MALGPWLTPPAGLDDQGFGFGGTGKKSVSRQFDDYGEAFGLHDVVGCLLDLDAGTVGFRYTDAAAALAFGRGGPHMLCRGAAQQEREAPRGCLHPPGLPAREAPFPGLHPQER